MKKFFGSRSTTKADVIFAVAGAIVAVYKALDTVKEYQEEKESK